MDGILRAAVAVTNAAFMGAAVDVTIQQWIGQDVVGDAAYATPIIRKALVKEGVVNHPMPDGQVVTSRAELSFVEVVEANGADGRQEPIDPRDIATLPSGLTGKIREVPGGTIDPQTGRPFVGRAWLV